MPLGSLDWTMVRWNHTVAAINILEFILCVGTVQYLEERSISLYGLSDYMC